MNRFSKVTTGAAVLIALLFPLWTAAATPDSDDAKPETAGNEQARAEYEALLEEAERARGDAEAARREAANAAAKAREAARLEEQLARERRRELEGHEEESERERAIRQEEMARVQEELSRAHRELREATREIARAHREVARRGLENRIVHSVNLGDRAVLGVILGRETPAGVEIIGVSPGGPAERAGLQAGDVLVSIRGESLAAPDDGGASRGRETLYRVMYEATPGEELALEVDRDGESWTFNVTPEQREPSSWQTMIRIPELADLPPLAVASGDPHVAIERIVIPEIDEEALNQRMQELAERLRTYKFVSPDGEEFTFDEDFELPEGFDVEVEELSELAEQALSEADIWFGLPHAQGLELAQINEGLGSYFKTDRGVLVLRAREGNAYELKSGDVVLDINGKAVNSPADLMRALREIEPGSDLELAIKRDRRDKNLNVVMPENRLGFRFPAHGAH